MFRAVRTLLSLFIIQTVCLLSSTSIIQLDQLKPEEIAIMQFDSRQPLSNYWLAAAKWNKYYCDNHGHRFIYFTLELKGLLCSLWIKYKVIAEKYLNPPIV